VWDPRRWRRARGAALLLTAGLALGPVALAAARPSPDLSGLVIEGCRHDSAPSSVPQATEVSSGSRQGAASARGAQPQEVLYLGETLHLRVRVANRGRKLTEGTLIHVRAYRRGSAAPLAVAYLPPLEAGQTRDVVVHVRLEMRGIWDLVALLDTSEAEPATPADQRIAKLRVLVTPAP
jgi:hypothetical protein